MPFRKLGDENSLSPAQTYARVVVALNQLPENWQLTQDLCDPKLFCGILVIDGKYIAVKGFEQKIPFIYGIDYLTHDIPHGDLFVAEDETAFSQFFQKLKTMGYDLKIVVADDRQGLKQALNKVFPFAKLQLCHAHFLENIRQLLNIRTDDRYQHFFNSLIAHVFKVKKPGKIIKGTMHVFQQRTYGNRTLQNIITGIRHREVELFNYLQTKNCPNNTNLIELYNSHLQARLKSLKGFQSFDSARKWLNAYLIRRRTKTLTDCKKKFKHLNKHCSLEFTIKKQALWPDSLTNLGINRVKFFQKAVRKALETER